MRQFEILSKWKQMEQNRYDDGRNALGKFGKIFKKTAPAQQPIKHNIDKAIEKSQNAITDNENLRAKEVQELQKLYSDDEIMEKYHYTPDEMNRFNDINGKNTNHNDNANNTANSGAGSQTMALQATLMVQINLQI